MNGRRLTQAPADKLIEEHAEFIAETETAKKIDELVDVVEVAIGLANSYGVSESKFMRKLQQKRQSKGGFSKGYLYSGDAMAHPALPDGRDRTRP